MNENERILILKMCRYCKVRMKCFSSGSEKCKAFIDALPKENSNSYIPKESSGVNPDLLQESELIGRLTNLICIKAPYEEIMCLTVALRLLRHPNER